MAQAVYQRLIEDQPLVAGGRVSSASVDVNGARAVNLLLRISSDTPQVEWWVYFQAADEPQLHLPAGTGPLSPAASGHFSPFFQPISIPVYGPRMTVMLSNRGTADTRCEGRLYFIREAG